MIPIVPILLGGVLAGGLFLVYVTKDAKKSKKQAQKRKKSVSPTCDPTIVRYGQMLLCEGGRCTGVQSIPPQSDDEAATYDVYWMGLFEKHAAMGLGAKPWNPTFAQAREILIMSMEEVFPECDWGSLPDSAQVGNATLIESIPGIQMLLMILGGQSGQQGS